jgi:dihydroflavonol-4-reductase
MKALVTGASGFLGGYVVRALMREGHEVTALVRRSSDLTGLRESGCTLAYGNLLELGTLRGAFQGVSAVFHLAAIASPDRSRREEVEAVNVQGTRNIVQLCAETKARLVHVSSVAAVGASESPKGVLNEESVNNTRGKGFFNFEAKARGEDIVLEACRSGAIDAVVVNPSVIVGAGDARKAARKGSIQAARGELRFYPEGGLSVVAAEDVAQGIVDAWKRGRSGERYVLSGENLTLEQVLSLYSELAGSRPPRHKLPSWLLRGIGTVSDLLKLGGPLAKESTVSATMYHWYDCSKATRELGFRPRPAREAVRDSVKWMIENGYLENF